MRTRYVKVHDRLILDNDLKPSSKRVYIALLCNQKNGQVRRTYADLAKQSGCSPRTVCRAVTELEQQGYITIQETYRFSETAQTVLRDSNVYALVPLFRDEGFTLVPCKLLKMPLTHSAFLVAVYLLKLIGMGRRAYPSLRRSFQKHLQMSRTTICAAIRQLVDCKALVHLQCLKSNRAYSCSTFIMTLWGETQVAQEPYIPSCQGESHTHAAPVTGGSVFAKHPVITKITIWLYRLKKKIFSKIDRFYDKRTAEYRTKLRPPPTDTG